MPGGGGGVVPRPRAQGRGRRRRQKQTPSLPLDVVLAIAARTDAATLVRCAATCAEARRRLVDDDPSNLRRRLRLRHTDRFVLPLLRGDLAHVNDDSYRRKSDTYLVDAAAADGCKVRRVTTGGRPLSSRDGLLLLRMDKELRVCDPATGRSHAVPLPPPETLPDSVKFNGKYVLLVGDGEDGGGGSSNSTGRSFQILLACLEVSPHRRYLQLVTFSPERGGAWSPCGEIRIPNLQGSKMKRGLGRGRAVVIGGAVHWLCLTDAGHYSVKLHVKTAQVAVAALPESVPISPYRWRHERLLAASSAGSGGSPVLLVADGNRVLCWAQAKQTAKWKPQPRVVVDTETMLRFLDGAGGTRPSTSMWSTTHQLELEWFAERSGAVLIRMADYHFFWLDLQSMEIIRWYSDTRISYGSKHCPYEMSLSDWVPTFNSTAV
ncbi:unnamed protein product [Urochloa decumbens]|uniref:DUF7595 domain-containing protein n=1 Tax=Urochloa decumbens TaxID=240449 RepID=A0ABC9G122_9POAL